MEVSKISFNLATSSTAQTREFIISRVLMSYQEIEPDIGCIHLIGRLDARTVPQIEVNFTFMATTSRKPVIVDLSGVELISSVGVGLLITAANMLRVHGKPMVLLNPGAHVEKVIRMAYLDQLLPIVHDISDALKKIQSQ